MNDMGLASTGFDQTPVNAPPPFLIVRCAGLEFGICSFLHSVASTFGVQ